ncbi:MAG: hypothetical protein M3Q68_06405, partial [Actinomycetota bacterium]|nr:hypothetical protein [Actinomycetota bacterium]
PGPASPPKPGVYRYRTSGGGAEERGEEDTTSRVEERGRSGEEVRLRVTTAGGRLTSASEVAWRPDGVRTLRTTFTFGESRGDCDWEPDVVDLQFPLGPGATWSSESSCAVTGVAPTPIPLSRSVRAEVIGLRRVRIDGQVVDVWAIRRVEKLSGAGASGESTAVALFSPRHGLDVEVTGTISSGQGSGEFRQVLLGLQPGPL